jgi:predicted transcriptional regulator
MLNITKKELEEKIKEMLKGIDIDHCDDLAYFETSAGQDFGKAKLSEIVEFINSIEEV